MFIRPCLRKGEIDLRVKAPNFLVEKIDLISVALGLSRQDLVLVALDLYVQEMAHVSKILSASGEDQRKSGGNETEIER